MYNQTTIQSKQLQQRYVPWYEYNRVVEENRHLREENNRLQKLCEVAQATIHQLHREMDELRQENQRLHQRIDALEKALNKEKQKPFKQSISPNNMPTEVKPDNTTQMAFGWEQPPSKKWASLQGHLGTTRHKPDQVDETIPVKVFKCRYCGSEDLTDTNQHREHIQEDIQIKRIRRRYVHTGAYCRQCKRVSFASDAQEIVNAYIGPQARTVAITLWQDGIPVDKVSRIFTDVFDLDVNPSAICNWYTQAAKVAMPVYEAIKQKVKTSSEIHADETGWLIQRRRAWLWIFINYALCLYVASKSRGSQVVKDTLGENYHGVLHSDFYGAYTFVKSIKQKCHAHLLRMANDILQMNGLVSQDKTGVEMIRFIVQESINSYNLYKSGKITAEDLNQQGQLNKNELVHIASQTFINDDAKRLGKLILKRQNELFVFMSNPNHAEPTNNRAERGLRPLVVVRKNSYGSISEQGAKSLAVIGSLIQTGRLHNTKPYSIIKALVLKSDVDELKKAVLGNQVDFIQLMLPFHDLSKPACNSS